MTPTSELFIGLAWLSIIIGFVVQYCFLRGLRRQFPKLWTELGSPYLLNDAGRIVTCNLLFYRDYREYHDKALTKFAHPYDYLIKIFHILALVFFVFCLLVLGWNQIAKMMNR